MSAVDQRSNLYTFSTHLGQHTRIMNSVKLQLRWPLRLENTRLDLHPFNLSTISVIKEPSIAQPEIYEQ